MRKHILFLALSLQLIQCTNNFDIDLTPVDALAPIYAQLQTGDLVSEQVRNFDTIDQIEYFGSMLLITEKEVGIHVVDNSDISNPQNIAFLNLPGITDFVIKDEYVVASLANHLVTIELIDVNNSTITVILDQPSPNGRGLYPNIEYVGKFECVDLSKGIVMGWEIRKVINPECKTIN